MIDTFNSLSFQLDFDCLVSVICSFYCKPHQFTFSSKVDLSCKYVMLLISREKNESSKVNDMLLKSHC